MSFYSYFLALLPDAVAVPRILEVQEKLCGKHPVGGNLRPAHVFHVSLHAIHEGGDMPLETARAVSTLCEAVAAVTAPFEIVFEQANKFPNSRALVLTSSRRRNGELAALHRALGLELRRRGKGLDIQLSASHHLTLCYGGRDMKESIEPVKWKVDEFVLVRSHFGLTHYDFPERWKLLGKPGSAPVTSRELAIQTEFRWE